MRSDEACARLLMLLREAGVDPDHVSAQDVEKTWAVWRQFAREPVEDSEPPAHDGDGILAQYGNDSGRFQLDMTRQFTFADDDGEYDHMTQLNCTFEFPASDELAAAGEGNMWSFGMSLDDFFDQALVMPGFDAVRADAAEPAELHVEYSDV